MNLDSMHIPYPPQICEKYTKSKGNFEFTCDPICSGILAINICDVLGTLNTDFPGLITHFRSKSKVRWPSQLACFEKTGDGQKAKNPIAAA